MDVPHRYICNVARRMVKHDVFLILPASSGNEQHSVRDETPSTIPGPVLRKTKMKVQILGLVQKTKTEYVPVFGTTRYGSTSNKTFLITNMRHSQTRFFFRD